MGGRGSSSGKSEHVYGGEYGVFTKKNLQKLIDMGANRWTKGNNDRLYLSGIGNEVFNLKIETYNSGNIKSATLDGEPISNREAFRVMDTYSKAYIDLKTGEIRFVGGKSEYRGKFTAFVRKFRRDKRPGDKILS